MKTLAWISAVTCLATASPSIGATVPFTGSFTNTNAPAATGGRCAGLTVSIANAPPFSAVGDSNFGSFTSTQSHCLDAGPPIAPGTPNTPYYDGLFAFSFAGGDMLTGSYDGLLSNSGAFGMVDNVQNFLITGGTGMFANASGSFLGTGQLSFAGGPPSATLTISRGSIAIGAVPEPATWALMLVGFAAIGSMQRSSRSSEARKLPA